MKFLNICSISLLGESLAATGRISERDTTCQWTNPMFRPGRISGQPRKKFQNQSGKIVRSIKKKSPLPLFFFSLKLTFETPCHLVHVLVNGIQLAERNAKSGQKDRFCNDMQILLRDCHTMRVTVFSTGEHERRSCLPWLSGHERQFENNPEGLLNWRD